MGLKIKISLLITLQIIIIIASFLILISFENERTILSDSINAAGKNSFFSSTLMHELMEYHITQDPSKIISNLNKYENNLHNLESVIEIESKTFLPMPDNIKKDFTHIYEDFVILKAQMLSDIEKNTLDDTREKLFDAQLNDLVFDTEILTKNITDYVEFLSLQTILLELFLGVVNIISHIVLIFIILRIQKNDDLRLVKLEKELHEKEKLSSVGELTSRLAHDLRNPLSIIKASLDVLKMEFGENESKQKQMDRIDRSIDRMVHQIDDVLDYVRAKPLNYEKVNVSDILSESLDSVVVPDGIRVSLPKNDVLINCDKIQLIVALNNLILNGIQAINGKGLIAISLKEKNDKIILEIEDSGNGISESDMSNVFTPLFTTKQNGTGLGLVSVKSIIESHGGTISVTSPPTIFTITLPKVSD